MKHQPRGVPCPLGRVQISPERKKTCYKGICFLSPVLEATTASFDIAYFHSFFLTVFDKDVVLSVHYHHYACRRRYLRPSLFGAGSLLLLRQDTLVVDWETTTLDSHQVVLQ